MSKTTNLSKRGFTLVELLIVIVVIAILAAISIVAYNGVQNRGKAAAAQSLASQVAKKAEAWNTIEGVYPTFAEFHDNVGDNTDGSPDAAVLDDANKVINTAPAADNQEVVQYYPCNEGTGTPNGGFVVRYWDAVAKGLVEIRGGDTTGTGVVCPAVP